MAWDTSGINLSARRHGFPRYRARCKVHFMKCFAALLLAVGVLSSVACKKKENNAPAPATTGGSSASPTPAAPPPTAAPPPPAKPSACVEGAYKDPNGNYCVKVPEGYKPSKSTRTAEGKSVDQFETDDGFNFSIEYWKPSDRKVTFDDMKQQYSTEGGDYKKVESGDFEGGNGFYSQMHHDPEKKTFTRSVVKSGDKLITCEAETYDATPLKPADACKTLRGL